MTDMPPAQSLVPAAPRPLPVVTRLVFGVAQRLLARIDHGSARLSLPNGHARGFGRAGSGHHAGVQVSNPALLWKTMARGGCGFGESYMSGDWETNDLAEVFRFFCDARDQLKPGEGMFKARMPDRVWHWLRDNTRTGSRRNIAYHYDLGNAFYQLWLDPGMTYSSADFTGGAQTLEAAQNAKYARVLQALEVGAGDHILEIGCGWGGFAEFAARTAQARVTGLTISNEQLRYARQRVAATGRDGQCTFQLRDYRDAGGQYDAIASIEMVEAVGEAHWPVYFKSLRDRLKPGKAAAVQAITIDERRFAGYRRRPDFVQRYIFPGGMLPTKSLMARHAMAAGLQLEAVDCFGASYARTLWDWRQRFMDAWPRIEALGFDRRFRRMWDYYLTYCAVGFETQVVDVGIYRFRRPG